MATLLERALTIQHRPAAKISQDDIDIAFAWLGDQVTIKQIHGVYGDGASTSRAYSRLSLALRQAYRFGQLLIKGDTK